MKIGIYCTNTLPYPIPEGTIYANMFIAGSLADQLTELGEDVTFFAPLGTQTKAKLVTFDMLPFSHPDVYPKYPHEGSSYEYENIMMIKALNYMTENNFDIFQSHTRPFSTIDFAPLKNNLPTALTLHDPIVDTAYKVLPFYNQFDNLHLISLSYAQREFQKGIHWAGNVYNGIDLNKWEFTPEPGKYLLYVGRIMPEKGPDIAVQIAHSLNLPLKIAGSIYPGHQEFFDSQIAPYVNEKIEYLGVLSSNQLKPLYTNAIALLMPVRWPEPFGLVMIEAMASGTPVIGSDCGAIPEIIDHSQTGFIVKEDMDNPQQYCKYIQKIASIHRQSCRKSVMEKFSIEAMTNSYLSLYRQMLQS